MSLAPYPTALYWAAGRGIARHAGREVVLTEPPHLPKLRIVTIDYRPGSIAEVMPHGEPRRDLEPHERRAAMALLEQLTQAAP